MEHLAENPMHANSPLQSDARDPELPPPLLILTELNPMAIIEGVMLDDGFKADDEVVSCGQMRETCPHCTSTHLQLVLRQKAVKLAHLFCPNCTRCYHASYEDGSPALALP